MDDHVDRQEFRALLSGKRAELLGDAAQMRRDADGVAGKTGVGDLSRAPSHMADRASDTQDQEFTMQRLSASSDTLQEIDAAMARLEAGTYGECEECGASIGARRLRIKPYASLCVKCRQAEEAS